MFLLMLVLSKRITCKPRIHGMRRAEIHSSLGPEQLTWALDGVNSAYSALFQEVVRNRTFSDTCFYKSKHFHYYY